LPLFGFVTAGLTAFYMFRMFFMTFSAKPRDHHAEEAHEVPWNMYVPLFVLAGLSFSFWFSGSLTGGLLGHADFFLGGANDWFVHLVNVPRVAHIHAAGHFEHWEHLLHVAHTPGMILSVIIALSGAAFSFLVFHRKTVSSEKLSSLWPRFVHKAIDNLYYFDFVYLQILIKKLFMPFSGAQAKFDDQVIDRIGVDGWRDVTMVAKTAAGNFDDEVIDGVMVDGIGGGLPASFGTTLRLFQNGKIQRYLAFAVGALVLLLFLKGVI